MRPNDANLVRAYLAAVYRAGRVELAFSRGRFARTVLASAPQGTWAIVTACNPMSAPLSDAENRERERRLVYMLDREGIESVAGMNSGPDGSWKEPSRLVIGLERARALAIARHFAQRAIVWSEGGRIGLLDCRTEAWTTRAVVRPDAGGVRSGSEGGPGE